MFFYHLSRILAYIPISLLYPTKTIGAKNIPKSGKVILACNHRSNMDIILIGIKTKKSFRILAKDDLFKNKFIGKVLKSYGAIEVDRDNVSPSVIKDVLKSLKDGKRLVLFPEGTRSDVEDSDTISAKHGTAMFAIKTKTPIVPMWIVKKPKVFHRNVLLIGKPFELTDFYGQKLSNQVLEEATNIVARKMEELRNNYLAELQAKKDKKKAKKAKYKKQEQNSNL